MEIKDGSRVSIIVEVFWYPQKCPHCAIFGHGDKTCPKKQVNVPVKQWILKQVKEVEVVNGENKKKQDTIVENLHNAMEMV